MFARVLFLPTWQHRQKNTLASITFLIMALATGGCSVNYSVIYQTPPLLPVYAPEDELQVQASWGTHISVNLERERFRSSVATAGYWRLIQGPAVSGALAMDFLYQKVEMSGTRGLWSLTNAIYADFQFWLNSPKIPRQIYWGMGLRLGGFTEFGSYISDYLSYQQEFEGVSAGSLWSFGGIAALGPMLMLHPGGQKEHTFLMGWLIGFGGGFSAQYRWKNLTIHWATHFVGTRWLKGDATPYPVIRLGLSYAL